MNLTLSNEEADLLLRMLKTDLGDLKVEISNTENYDWRVDMKKDAERIRERHRAAREATASV